MCIICVVLFFFKQETAYEMRIRDWSSDVCSSDLEAGKNEDASADHASMNHAAMDHAAMGHAAPGNASMQMDHSMHGASGVNAMVSHPASETGNPAVRSEERRVGKECVIRVTLGGRRIIKKKNQQHTYTTLT